MGTTVRAAKPSLAVTDALGSQFRRFAESECGAMPLYRHLSLGIAKHKDLLALCRPDREGVPQPNLLLAAAHYLLLRGAEDIRLRQFYPDFAALPAPAAEAFPVFRRFCLRHRGAIMDLMARRGVGTSEVQRAACLLPAFHALAVAMPAFHYLDMGSGAGFNLLWDRFAYDYNGRILGDPKAALTLKIRLQGTWEPGSAPRVLSRQAVDIDPPDLTRPEDRDWLRALIWPEQPERALRLEAALDLVRGQAPLVRRGDALAVLPGWLAGLPDAAPASVGHAFCLNQWSETQKRRLETILRGASRQRAVARLSYEWGRRGKAPQIRLYLYRAGKRRAFHLADADAHGAWLVWRGVRVPSV